MEPEIPVEDTNAEAMASKISAINKGYFEDNFAKIFINTNMRKDIIIHRGYWGRVNIFRLLVERFLQVQPDIPKQIISLGSGYDTMYFNLKTNHNYKQINFKYFEIDLPNVVKNKVKRMKNCKQIKDIIPDMEVNEEKTLLKSAGYTIIGQDLSNINELDQKLKATGLDYNIPTFIFAECVLTYINSKATDNLLQYFSTNFSLSYLMDYEMFNPNDPFGKMMVKNFELKGCPLIGIFEYPTMDSQKTRLEKLNYQQIEIYDMLTIYNKYTDQQERKRIEKIEMMDEYEEWNIMQSHYFVFLAMHYKDKIDNQQIENMKSTFIQKVKIHLN